MDLAVYHLILELVNSKTEELEKLSNRYYELKNDIKVLTRLQDKLSVGVCTVCNGYGVIRDYMIQDEVKHIKCIACDGKGTKK